MCGLPLIVDPVMRECVDLIGGLAISSCGLYELVELMLHII